VVICFINDVTSQRAEQFKNVQDLALAFAARVGCVIQPFQSLQAPIHDKLRHARIVHATEAVLKTSRPRRRKQFWDTPYCRGFDESSA
jgi:hypothetical protein